MDREKLDRWCEWGVLGLTLALLVYTPLAFGGARTIDRVVLMGFALCLLLIWTVRIWVRKNYRFLGAPVCWAVIAFVGYAIYKYTDSRVEYAARLDLIDILIYGVFFFCILDNLNKQEWTQAILFTLVGVGVLMSFYALYQSITGSRWIYNTPQPALYYGRASGPFVCPNHLAGYLELTLPTAIAFAITSRLKPVFKILLGYAAIVMCAGLAVTISRGGYLAAGIGLLVFFSILLFNRDYRLPAAIFLAVLLVAGGVFARKSFLAQKRVASAQSSAGNWSDERVQYWKAALAIWREHYWTGGGLNHFDFLFHEHRSISSQARPARAHNDYLNTLADMGIIGFALVLICWALLLHGVIRTWKYVYRINDISTRPSSRFAVVLGAAIGLLSILIHSFFDFNMHIPANAVVTVLLFAVLTGHVRYATERFWFDPGILGRALGTLLALGAIYGLFISGRKLGKETILLRRADVSTTAEAMDLRKAAFEIDPLNFENAQNIGEMYRLYSWEGLLGYEKLAQDAIIWFERSVALNPYNVLATLRIGMCYDWLKQPAQATDYMMRAKAMDANSMYVRAILGWHYFQIKDYEKAQFWLEKSWYWGDSSNVIGRNYLKYIKEKLALPPDQR